MKIRTIPTGRQRRKKRIRTVFLALLVIIAAGTVFAGATYMVFSLNLPKLKTIDDYNPALPTIMFDKDGNEAAIVFVEWHTRVKQKFNKTGEVIIMLTGAPAARHRYR